MRQLAYILLPCVHSGKHTRNPAPFQQEGRLYCSGVAQILISRAEKTYIPHPRPSILRLKLFISVPQAPHLLNLTPASQNKSLITKGTRTVHRYTHTGWICYQATDTKPPC
jgi:hypothetical protein